MLNSATNTLFFCPQHMIKYRYLPFTHSKPKYKTVDSAVTVN